ncbi:MAG: site-specific DNA-methyltransferase, partial [Malacoplasma sp.]
MNTTNLSKIKRDKMLKTINEIKINITDENILKNLSMIENELTKKKYGLIWEEHEERVDKELETRIPTFEEINGKKIFLKQNEKFDFLLEGDNLHSLYLLEKTHKGKVDVIYIDPPYNTNNKDFVYNDEMINFEDGYRHSKWVSFMHKRINIAKKLLSNKGIIFISIDDNEYSQLKLLCDDIFDEENYVSTLHWKKKKQPSYLHGQVAGVMEYILVYSKHRNQLDKLSLSTPTDSNARIDNASNQVSERLIRKGISVKLPSYVNCIKAGVYKNKTMETEYLNNVIIKNGITVNDFIAKARFRDSQERIDLFCEQGVFFITKNYGFRRDKLESELSKKKAITDLILDWGDNQDSDVELKNIFGEKIFSYPKPKNLIKNLIKSTGYNDAIVLDFFAGSGTTAQAVLELNKEENLNLKFILCTNNENKICEKITYQRLKTVITGMREDNSVYSDGINSNLKYYRTSYIPRINTETENLHDNLLINIKNLIQLENGIEIDNNKIRVYMNEEELDNFTLDIQALNDCEKIYISSDILLTSKQEEIFKNNNIELYIIPDYYFKEEIMEV